MIDLHAHFLPGIDDGAKDVKDSIKMLAEAHKQGVTLCAGTPHATIHGNGDIETFLAQRANSIKMLSALPLTDEIPDVVFGAEVFLDNDISKYSDIKKLCIGGSNLLLVELSTQKLNPNYSEWLYSLSLMGIIPIIAHIERYPYFEEFAADLGDISVAFQMNCKTVLNYGWRKYLLERSLPDSNFIVASDMHDMRFRKCRMKKAFNKVGKKYSHIAEQLFVGTASRLLNAK